ncbi:uncharacterized protein LOC144654092 [Oculina patagonica]
MAEEAKSIRRSAKARFTRKRNELLKSIADRRGIEVVELNYAQLTEAWAILEGKHDIYVMHLTDEEAEATDSWITELQDLFVQATALKIDYVNDIRVSEARARAEENREESNRKEREQIQRAAEQAFVKRETARAIFDTLCDSTAHTLEGERISVSLMKKLQSQLGDAFSQCKMAHDKLLELLDRQSAETEIKWIAIVQGKYNELVEQLENHIDADENKDSNPTGGDFKVKQAACATSTNLHLEKIRMPRFEGELREYPRFKSDFQKQVMPHLTRDTAPYTLRSCLGKEPLARVKSVDDDIEEMWKRLDEIYGDPTKVADVIINDIRRVKAVKEGENKRFVELVNIIEDGHRDLRRLGLESEIRTTSSVSIIKRKLPTDIRKEWAKLLSSEPSPVDRTNKFPSLLQFLLTQKRAIEYDSAELRIFSAPTAKVFTHYAAATGNKDHQRPGTFSKCVFHDNAEHFTSECKLYLSKPVGERIKMLKEKGACWSCLRYGHRLRNCKKAKECGVSNCKKKHHVTLHESEVSSSSAPSNAAPTPAPSNACTSLPGDRCLLQLQRIRTPRGFVNVMWDNASSLSFITNNKAKAERLHGTPLELTLVKVGADEEKISSRKYQLPLIDVQGKRILFEVYGIEKITSNIQSVNVDNISHLFSVPSDDIQRPTGTVDVLIGYEYAGFHPDKEQSAEHLLLLRNRFGRCIGGTHPSIREMTEPPKLDKVHQIRNVKIDDFYNVEQLGVECTPRCGGCKCGKCPPGGKDYTLKEERELQLIEGKLQFSEQENAWVTEYPWIKDPYLLPNNRRAAFGRLVSTERRLGRNPQHAKVYQQQIEDMIERGVARKLTKEEFDSYEGPIHYISHHDVLKPDSKSIPVRIVFNSSANYMGHVLNDYWVPRE